MSRPTIVSMPGDGIGKTVLPEAVRVLDAAGFAADYVHADIGWDCWCSHGDALPRRTIDLLETHRVGLFGAITSKPREAAEKELAPELRGRGHVYYSPIVTLRQHFNMDVCVRPCRSFPGNPLNFVRRGPAMASQTKPGAGGPAMASQTKPGAGGPGGSTVEPKVDVVVFRQNTEDLYCGVEWTDPPQVVRKALETHPKMAAFRNVASPDLAVSCRILSRPATRRILEEAFRYASANGYRSVTVCEKPNVVRETSGMVFAEAREVQKTYPDIQLWDTNIDAQMMWLTKNPEDYGVIVASNMFGDIVSDGFAGLVGGLGFAASANLGRSCAVYEPTHGSAPKYAEYGVPIVNPIAMILSACMMLEDLGRKPIAKKITDAIARVVAEGKVRTYDMCHLKGAPDVIEKGAASTTRMTDAIISALDR